MPTKRINISFKPNGDGKLECVGFKTFTCLGDVGREYPADLTVQGVVGVDKFALKHSQEFDVDMPWAILIWGQKGIYIHGWPGPATVADYGEDTNGCIHLQSDEQRGDAKEVYNWVDGPTRILIDYPW